MRKKINLSDDSKEESGKPDSSDFFQDIKKIAKQYEDIEVLNFEDNIDFEYYIPTGLKNLDSKLSGGKGIPKGGLVEIFGPESSGKSHLALRIASMAQMTYPEQTVIYFDLEDSLMVERLKFLNVNLAKNKFMKVSNNLDAESLLNLMIKMIEEKSNRISLIVLDSVASLIPKELYDKDEEKRTTLIPALLSKKLKILNTIANKNNVGLLFVNQLRENMAMGFTYPGKDLTYTPGGRALRHVALLRIEMKPLSKSNNGVITVNNEVVGHRSRVKIVKNKLGPPIGEDVFSIYYEEISVLDRLILLGREVKDATDNKVISTHGEKVKFNSISYQNINEFTIELISNKLIYTLYDELYKYSNVEGIIKEDIDKFLKEINDIPE